MGPLFSALVIILAIATFVVAAFLVALFFQPVSWAIRSAVVFFVGVVSGVILATLLLLFVGVGATFVSSSEVLAYLSSLAFGGLLGGSLLLSLFIKAMRSNSSSKRDRLKQAP